MVTPWKKYKAVRKLLLDAYRREELGREECQRLRNAWCGRVLKAAVTGEEQNEV